MAARPSALDPRADGGAPQESRRARCATCAWIRSASRSRTSTRSGKWRTTSRRHADRCVGALPDGTTFDGVAGLRQLVAAIEEDFARTFTQKLLAYALGRGVERRRSARRSRITRTSREAIAGRPHLGIVEHAVHDEHRTRRSRPPAFAAAREIRSSTMLITEESDPAADDAARARRDAGACRCSTPWCRRSRRCRRPLRSR